MPIYQIRLYPTLVYNKDTILLLAHIFCILVQNTFPVFSQRHFTLSHLSLFFWSLFLELRQCTLLVIPSRLLQLPFKIWMLDCPWFKGFYQDQIYSQLWSSFNSLITIRHCSQYSKQVTKHISNREVQDCSEKVDEHKSKSRNGLLINNMRRYPYYSSFSVFRSQSFYDLS